MITNVALGNIGSNLMPILLTHFPIPGHPEIGFPR